MPYVEVGESLSPREQEVILLLVSGYTRREAAYQMCLSVRTVDYYLSRILDKTKQPTLITAVIFALNHGLVMQNTADETSHMPCLSKL